MILTNCKSVTVRASYFSIPRADTHWPCAQHHTSRILSIQVWRNLLWYPSFIFYHMWCSLVRTTDSKDHSIAMVTVLSHSYSMSSPVGKLSVFRRGGERLVVGLSVPVTPLQFTALSPGKNIRVNCCGHLRMWEDSLEFGIFSRNQALPCTELNPNFINV